MRSRHGLGCFWLRREADRFQVGMLLLSRTEPLAVRLQQYVHMILILVLVPWRLRWSDLAPLSYNPKVIWIM